MKFLAPKHWPVGTRRGYCWMAPGIEEGCVMKVGFPFKCFWDELGVDFDEFVVHHMSINIRDEYIKAEWQKR